MLKKYKFNCSSQSDFRGLPHDIWKIIIHQLITVSTTSKPSYYSKWKRDRAALNKLAKTPRYQFPSVVVKPDRKLRHAGIHDQLINIT